MGSEGSSAGVWRGVLGGEVPGARVSILLFSLIQVIKTVYMAKNWQGLLLWCVFLCRLGCYAVIRCHFC